MAIIRDISENLVGLISATAPPPELSRCYTIPYGAFGFASHVITLYTMYCSASRRSPWTPWKHKPAKPPGVISKYTPGGLVLLYRIIVSFVKVSVTFALSIYTIYRCSGAYRLLAVWKMMLSCFDGATEGLFLYHRQERQTTGNIVFFAFQWCILFFPGVVAGITGLKRLAEQYWDSSSTLHTVTWIFVGVFAATIAVTIYVVTTKSLHVVDTKSDQRRNKAIHQSLISESTTTVNGQSKGSMAHNDSGTLDLEEKTATSLAFSDHSIVDGADNEPAGRQVVVAGLGETWKKIEVIVGLDQAGCARKFFEILFRVLGVSLVVAYVLGTGYADWIIGVVAGNLGGVPHERILGGLYFAAKHLSFLLF